MAERHFDVVVVGAGPVGLGLALELGLRGISVLLVERNVRGGAAPRAKTTNTRTRAHLRRWGIADRLAAASPLGVDYPNDIHFVTSLGGYSLTVFHDAFNAAPSRNELYPEHAQWVPQYTLERVMLERVRELPSVEVRFGTTFLNAEQGGLVTSTIRSDQGAEEVVRSHYLVGADGARSTVRELIGAKMEGRRDIARASNVIVRAPGLADAHPHGPGVMFVQIQREGTSVLGQMDQDDVWYFGTGLGPDEAELSDERALADIRRTTGIDLPFEILSKDIWVASELVADRYSRGRIILAGDACHLHPPFGGYGMNMGVGDAVDLGWKIAAELQGWGGSQLVNSYESERRPIHLKVIEEAIENHKMILRSPWREGLEDNTAQGAALRAEVGAELHTNKAREYHTLGTVLGLCYEGSAIIAREDGPAPPQGGQTYFPSGHPGCLAPHGWLDDGRSLYDAFGRGFSLVVAEDVVEGDLVEARQEAADLGAPLEIVRPGDRIAARYDARLALVRPDQIIAWRGNIWERSPLRMATGSS